MGIFSVHCCEESLANHQVESQLGNCHPIVIEVKGLDREAKKMVEAEMWISISQ